MSNEETNAADSIAVIGGGLSGLIAARRLAQAGARVAVFDKGRAVGGRMSTRHAEGDRRFDHGAQYFTVRSEAFRAEADAWLTGGVAVEWAAELAVIECGADGCRRGETPSAKTRYVGAPGMDSIAKHLADAATAAGARVTAGVRVAPLKRAEGHWRLSTDSGESLGDYARVLVTTPAPQAAELLTASPALANAARSVRMTGCWAVMAAFDGRLETGFDGAFVNGSPGATPLAWIARDGSKPGRPDAASAGDCWVLHGSAEWSEANLELSTDRAADALTAAFFSAAGVAPVAPLLQSAHRWRYALPETPLAEPVLIDRERGLFAAGDWCGGPRVEGACLSGMAAAAAILENA